jgi:hypothetical protein
MVEHAVTIDHSFKSAGGAEIVAHVDSAKNSIDVYVKLGTGENSITLTVAELGQLADLFDTAAAFLQGKPHHKSAFGQDEAAEGQSALERESVG